MGKVYLKEEIEGLINDNEILLLYFSSKSCGVCKVIKPELDKVLKLYPNIKTVQIDVEGNIKLAASYSVFTLPAVIVFVNGKETIREARYINVEEIKNRLDRYYKIIYENDLKALMDYRAQIKATERNGRIEGDFQARLSIARNFLDVLDDETIAMKVGLSIDEIKKLRNK
ncbi:MULTISPECIES: thioredoxin family protein [Clostridium]|uniref:thioredoxin family protein n=1 Tax=Clostridium TaxID=1485 RepID=UPI0012FDFDB9|nr:MULTISPECIES: thioredoxin family protein [Clostridium]